jgi:hypothetical protein
MRIGGRRSPGDVWVMRRAGEDGGLLIREELDEGPGGPRRCARSKMKPPLACVCFRDFKVWLGILAGTENGPHSHSPQRRPVRGEAGIDTDRSLLDCQDCECGWRCY